MILSDMNLKSRESLFSTIPKIGHSPKEMLLLLQHIQSLREDGPDGTPSHLNPQILSVRLITGPVSPLSMSPKKCIDAVEA